MSTVDETGFANVVSDAALDLWAPMSEFLSDVFLPGWQYVVLGGVVFVVGWKAVNRWSRVEG